MMLGTTIVKAYLPFYLDGREDPLDEDDLDVDGLTEKALAGPDDVRTVVIAAVVALAAPLEHDRERREWIADNEDAIKDAGGDGAEAYRHYLKGRVDQTAHVLENDVVESMYPEDEEGDEEEDDEDDEDGDGDDDEDDDDDDDEDQV